MDLNITRLAITPNPESLKSIMQVLTGKGRLFEEILQKLSCRHSGTLCEKCYSNQSCPIPFLTGRQLSYDPEVVRRFQKPGLPYIFERVSTFDREPESFLLTLLGTACIHISLFLSALDELTGVRSSCRIATVDYQQKQSEFVLIGRTESANLPILSAKEFLFNYDSQFNGCKRVEIEIKSPLRIMKNGRELQRFEPVQFIRSMLRRVSSLFLYYGFFSSFDQFKNLVELAENVKLVKIAPFVTDYRGSVRGVGGLFELTGAFDELGGVLKLGSMFHLGKGASYNMGVYEITPIS